MRHLVLVSAANPTADQANGVAASGEIHLEGIQFGVPVGTCSVNVDFVPLQMDNNGANITGTTPTIKIGQFVELQVKDPSGWGGLVAWSMPSGTTVEEYHPQVNGATANFCGRLDFCNGDLYAAAIGSNLSQQVVLLGSQGGLSFAWVRPGGAAPGPTDSETAILSWNRFGQASVQGTFKILEPTVDATEWLLNPAIISYPHAGKQYVGLGNLYSAPQGGFL